MRYVLDLDDTLYLERDFVRSGYLAVDRLLSETHSLDGFFEFAWRRFLRGKSDGMIDRFLDATGKEAEEKRRLSAESIEAYRSHVPEIKLLPDAEEFLSRHLPENLAMITDGFSTTQWNKIDVLGLRERIGTIIVTDDWGQDYRKPHPRAFLEIQGDFPPDRCVYVGDNPQKDFLAPQRLAWATSLRIRRPGSLHEKRETPVSCREIPALDRIPSTS